LGDLCTVKGGGKKTLYTSSNALQSKDKKNQGREKKQTSHSAEGQWGG